MTAAIRPAVERGPALGSLSRRSFLAISGGLAASLGLPRDLLGRALAAPAEPADVPTTLRETIRQASTGNRGYRTLRSAPGEAFIVRTDLIGRQPGSDRETARRSLAYLGHTSDIHVQDTQTPARLEPVNGYTTTLVPGSHRPQEAMSLHVQAQMVQAFSDAAFSPVTGAPMAAVLNTGDSSDQISNLETRWYIKIMDGVPVYADSGTMGVYEGVQVWPEATYAYHPEDPSADPWGAYGFPQIPGLMQAIVSTEVTSPGMPAPWYSVFGNHDVLFNGFIGQDDSLRTLATGDVKYYSFESWIVEHLTGISLDVSPIQRMLNHVRQQFAIIGGFKRIGSDPERRLLEGQDFMAAHFEDTGAGPGPVGHGWAQSDLEANRTYWTADLGESIRMFGLDTCNRLVGADGAVPRDQFDWLEAGLAECVEQDKLAIILSHHNTLTLENTAESVFHPGEELIHAPDFVTMLLRYPNMILWLNGHTHMNTIRAHRGEDGSGGFWEVTTASCIDYPQQQQLVDICDNRDGTLSIFAITLDHASDAQWTDGDLSQRGIASLSRELASNDWVATPLALIGSELDRNVELLVPAPFPMDRITNAALARGELARRAAVLKNTAGVA
jgi:metallophosphoesterase (TIGR03767 family)